ncbi:hypothetical protein [Caballeronia grimmiae]|uniref:Uncharacterized protein n=1 Tax=Caballeronia grimmiae TaxID=1071679 RepID=A0A069NNS6_9BURK|nr:hypothetical protein [Caballeronia grimmiae]KDR30050.1 hypothetical protein BG57_15200 [Caballeronia grimmiae]GGD91770.1 hypothetical protein GCM10010985_53140 [Caballeronia grimmiae]
MHVSEWKFGTSATGGGGIGTVLLSGGLIVLADPKETLHAFHYGGFGFGISKRLPERIRLPDLRLRRRAGGTVLSGTGGTTQFDSYGVVYSLIEERELIANDFTGGVIYAEVSAGALFAVGGSCLFVGIDQKVMMLATLNPGLFARFLLRNAKAMIVVVGDSEGLIDGIGGGAMLGAMTYEGPFKE